MKIIGIQGAKGSFCEEAAEVFTKNHGIKKYKIDFLISSDGVITALEERNADYGVIAMENAQGGVVIESVNALAHHRCEILEMFYIPISQNLLVLPGTHIGYITEVHSHQQALRQCRNYLAEHFWTRPLIETDDTAAAAQRLRDGLMPETSAVIGSKSCAELYDLLILDENIHDLKDNLTLFLGIKRLEDNNE